METTFDARARALEPWDTPPVTTRVGPDGEVTLAVDLGDDLVAIVRIGYDAGLRLSLPDALRGHPVFDGLEGLQCVDPVTIRVLAGRSLAWLAERACMTAELLTGGDADEFDDGGALDDSLGMSELAASVHDIDAEFAQRCSGLLALGESHAVMIGRAARIGLEPDEVLGWRALGITALADMLALAGDYRLEPALFGDHTPFVDLRDVLRAAVERARNFVRHWQPVPEDAVLVELWGDTAGAAHGDHEAIAGLLEAFVERNRGYARLDARMAGNWEAQLHLEGSVAHPWTPTAQQVRKLLAGWSR